MSFTNINDPAGVKALLEQLRSSQAWHDTVNQPNVTPPIGPPPTTRTVAGLLSQLQTPAISPSEAKPADNASSLEKPVQLPVAQGRPHTQDNKPLTFQQALPVLAQLCDDPSFVSLITQMKEEQADLERTLWAERRAIFKKYEDKVNVARTKANMIGSSLSKHEAEVMLDAFHKELREFDRSRILPAWDGLIAKQQAALESRAVPMMAVTTVPSDRERQQRLIRVLEGILGPENLG